MILNIADNSQSVPNASLLSPTETGDRREQLNTHLRTALDSVEDPSLRHALQPIADAITTVFDRLFRVERNLQELDTLRESLSVMQLLHVEIRSLIDFIENRAMKTEGLSTDLHEALDGLSYSMSHDLKRIFDHELTDATRDELIPVVYGKIKHAHGILTNCFQQSSITLLQAIDPSIDPIEVFNHYEQRLKQSLLLCHDLSALLRVAKLAEENPTLGTLRTLAEKVNEFREGNMQYLMYRDWRAYEQYAVALVSSIESNFDTKDLIHQFRCFVEVLYGHVKMRTVLKEIFPQEASF